MGKRVNTSNRRSIPALLAREYVNDYHTALAAFPEDKKIELVDHLLECLEIIETNISSPTEEYWKIYRQKENSFLKKHGNRLKVYRQNNMYLYYGDARVLVEKEIYSTAEWNKLDSEQQSLTPQELISFIHLCKNALYNEQEFLLIKQNPQDEIADKSVKDTLNGSENTPQRFKVKREAQDKLTCLSQEQTVLLMYYLQQERVFLKDEYLKGMDAGKAFEILTGYSQHTLRQNLGKFYHFQNKQNLKEIDHLLTRLKIAIDKALKEK
jgi:hypothetical protein